MHLFHNKEESIVIVMFINWNGLALRKRKNFSFDLFSSSAPFLSCIFGTKWDLGGTMNTSMERATLASPKCFSKTNLHRRQENLQRYDDTRLHVGKSTLEELTKTSVKILGFCHTA